MKSLFSTLASMSPTGSSRSKRSSRLRIGRNVSDKSHECRHHSRELRLGREIEIARDILG
jgi:hypothetical protein